MRKRTRKLGLAGLVAFITMGVVGCGLFGGDEVFDLPIETSTDFDVSFDVGAVTGEAAGQQAPERLEYDLTLPGIPIDFTTVSEDLNDNKSKLREVSITFIKVTPTENTVTGELPDIDLYINASGTTGIEGGHRIATIPPIQPGSLTPVNATIHVAGMEAAQPMITSLKFNVVPSANLVVEQGETVPGGAAALNIEIGLRAVVNPTK